MTFRKGTMTYHSTSAVGIVGQLQREAVDYKRTDNSLYHFLLWSLSQLDDQVSLRELDLSDLVDAETLALSYLCLLDRYGVGELLD
jgi:hypothetical protein